MMQALSMDDPNAGVQAARDAWVPRLSSANAAARRLPTRLAKFGSAPGDFSRQRSVLAQYDLPLPHARTAGAAAFAPVLGADDAPPYYGPPARARTAGPSIAAEEELYFDSPARGGSGRFAAEPAGYMPPLRSGSMAAEYVYESQPQRTKTVEVRTERAEFEEARPQRTRTVGVRRQRGEYQDNTEQELQGSRSRAEKDYVLQSEKSFTQGYKAGLDAARAFAARAASGQFSAEADDDYFAEGAQQETGVSGGIKRAGGVRRAVSSMPEEHPGRRPYNGDADLHRSRSAPRPARVRYDDEEGEGSNDDSSLGQDVRQGPGVRTSVEDNGMAAEEALEEDMMDLDLQQEANVPEVELPSFQTLVQRQKSQQVLHT
jgi:hypothetical protein